jgi:hypothetical protein
MITVSSLLWSKSEAQKISNCCLALRLEMSARSWATQPWTTATLALTKSGFHEPICFRGLLKLTRKVIFLSTETRAWFTRSWSKRDCSSFLVPSTCYCIQPESQADMLSAAGSSARLMAKKKSANFLTTRYIRPSSAPICARAWSSGLVRFLSSSLTRRRCGKLMKKTTLNF